jgi:hypothetical protein
MPTVQFQLGGTLKFLVEEPAGYVLVTLQYGQFSVTAKGNHMAYTLPNTHEVQVQVAYVDAKGNPATIDGDVTWGSSDNNIATVTVDADTTRCKVTPAANIGNVQITATADADLGEGTRELITTMDVTVVAGEAVAGTITPAGAPTPIS